MDQDATQVRILRPPSRDENCVRPKLTDHGTIEVLSVTKTLNVEGQIQLFEG